MPPTKEKPKASQPEQFLQISLDRIVDSPHNPRRKLTGVDELAESIKARGVLVPIMLRPKGADWEDMELVAGHRRTAAARKAGLTHIPAIVRGMDDREALEIQAIEMDQRVDVPPLEQARFYQQLLIYAGHTIATLADKIGREETFVRRRLQLMQLTKDWLTMLDDELIGYSHAVQICRLPASVQESLYAQYGADKWGGSDAMVPASELEKIIRDEYYLDLAAAAFPKDQTIDGVIPCAQCQKRTGADGLLFPDVKKGDHCLDKACFEQKREAFVGLQIKAVKEKAREQKLAGEEAPPIVTVSSQQTWTQGKVLGTQDYEQISAKAAEKVPPKLLATAVVTAGPDAGKTMLVKLAKPVGEDGKPKTEQSKWAQQNATNEAKAKQLKAVHEVAFKEIARGVDGVVSPETIRELVKHELMSIESEQMLLLIDAMGWQRPKSTTGYGWMSKYAERELPKLSQLEAGRLLNLMLIAQAADVSTYSPKTSPEFVAAAKEYGVDLKKISDELKAAAKGQVVAEVKVGKGGKTTAKGKAINAGKKVRPAAAVEPDAIDDLIEKAEQLIDAGGTIGTLQNALGLHRDEATRLYDSVIDRRATAAAPKIAEKKTLATEAKPFYKLRDKVRLIKSIDNVEKGTCGKIIAIIGKAPGESYAVEFEDDGVELTIFGNEMQLATGAAAADTSGWVEDGK